MPTIDTPYPLDAATIRRFQNDGFIRLPNVLGAEVLAEITPEITRLVDEGNRLKNIPLEERTLYDQAFIQVMNLWTRSERVREFAFGKRLARIAAELAGHPRHTHMARSGVVQGAVRRFHALARRSTLLADVQSEFGHGLDSAPTRADRDGAAVLRPRQPSQAHRPRSGDQRRKRAANRGGRSQGKDRRGPRAVRARRRQLPPRLDAAPRWPQHHDRAPPRVHHHLHGCRYAARRPEEQEPAERLGCLDAQHPNRRNHERPTESDPLRARG